MSDLIEFLRARLDEDLYWAKSAEIELGQAWSIEPFDRRFDPRGAAAIVVGPREVPHRLVGEFLKGTAGHVARWDPARVLAEVEAKRQVIRLQELAVEYGSPATATCPSNPRCACNPCLAVYALARVLVDHPDFDPAWRRDD